jgi:dipeptidyl-peptidase-4
VFAEIDDAWVDVHDDLAWLGDGERFLWTSERDGWRHLYLYRRDGSLERQLTQGEWELASVDGVDEERALVYVTAAYESPLTRTLLAVPLRGGEPYVLAGGRGSHGLELSPDARLGIHSHSMITTPTVTTLVRVGAEAVTPVGGIEAVTLEPVRELIDNSELHARLDEIQLGTVEFLTVPAADGTPLNAYLVRPPDFDPNRRYGLLLYVYGGPGSQTVVDRWGGSRLLWFHYLAQQGVLVASVDNRGTGARGRDFKKQTYLKLGQLETADQLAAAEHFGSVPYVDANRIGIWGWSYGGYMTLNATLLSGGAIAAGASVAPVSHWQLYDTIYTERFMRTPQENPEGYAVGSPLSHAEKLESDLLIVHGTGDDNVHSQNTLLMAQALEQADKQFEMRLYPNKRHGISGATTRVNLHRLLTDFLVERLAPGVELVP